MLNSVLDMFSYPFMQRAVIAGLLISLCAALLGVILVLKNLSMIGDGLSHVAFGATAVALVANLAPLKIAIPVVLIAAFFLMHRRHSARLRGDAAVAILSTGALAIGVMAISVTPGVNVDLSSYMFGSILAVSREDVLLCIVLSTVILLLFILFYPRIFAVTFDEDFARASGLRAEGYALLCAALTAVTVVIGMRLMGAMLISSLIIFPAVTSLRLFRSFRAAVLSSAVLSALCFLCGITVSYFFSTPAGASIVCVNIVFYLLFSLAGMLTKRVR
ncbi:MAG: metal ABC transporter permease [Clostridia bacterium]|nr:metal ABC transporter permease [Clostridia bacterium]